MRAQILFYLLATFLPVCPAEAGSPAPAPQVKAAFLFNFLKFVEWPERAFDSAKAPYVIGVLGRDPFGEVLDNTFKDRVVSGRNVVVRRVTDAEIAQCHLLFIGNSERRRISDIIGQTRSLPILTVGDTPGFAEQGVIINLYEQDKRIRFEVNMQAAQTAGLKLHASMLNLAKIVRSN